MKRRKWLRLAFVATALLLIASWGISGALEAGWARRSLTARLSASFGRPVEVGHFGFSLLSGPHLEADSVTVAEDPRFGQEYFLRADQLTASLRWAALLRGKIEFGALSLTNPSLNVVRAPDGSWNIESWLPPAKATPADRNRVPFGPPDVANRAETEVPPRFANIEVDGGRINFKRGVQKLQFALVDVSGHLDQDSAGRWSLDLEANPMRASVALQEAGTLRLQGTIAGTSARLRPAALQLTWEDASLADAVRLAHGGDYGIRGTLGAEFSARIENPPAPSDKDPAGGEWTVQGIIRLAGVHGWNLAGQSANPAVNMSVTASWRTGEPRLEVIRCVVESPQSRVDATGDIDWSRGFNPRVQVVSSRISLADLLAWRRAFSPDVADDLAVNGTVEVNATLAGWPPRIEQAGLTSTGAVVRADVLPGPINVGPILAMLSRGSIALSPVSVALPDVVVRAGTRNAKEITIVPAGTLHVNGSLGPFRAGNWPRDWPYQLAVSGQTARAQDLVAAAAVFGKAASTDWTVVGPAGVHLAWTGSLRRGTSTASGTLDLSGLQLTSVVLNQPMIVSSARVELRPGQRHVKLAEAQAFGAHWTGSLDWRATDDAWSFDLSADRLDSAELDRWLGPRARPGLLERMLPFAEPSNPAASRDAVVAQLKAHGRLRVGEVALAPLRIEKLDAAVEIAGRSIALRRAQMDFYGGRVSGDLEARLSAEPMYTFRGQIERINLAALTAATASLAGRFAGMGAGRLTLTARGVGRPALLASLEGQGVLNVRDAVLHGIDLSAWAAGSADALDDLSESRFGASSATFHVDGGRVRVDRLLLAARNEQFEIAGSVGFARQLDLRLRSMPRGSEPASDASLGGDACIVAGTLDAPQVTRPGTPQGTREENPASGHVGLPTARR